MNDVTQPMTDAERRARQDWLERMAELQMRDIAETVDFTTPVDASPYPGPTVRVPDGSNPGEFDWFAINREFS